MSDNITLPRAVGELIGDLIDHAYSDGVEGLERPSEQTIKALNTLGAALAEPPATREPATHGEISEKFYSTGSNRHYWQTSYSLGWRAAERFHNIRKEDKTCHARKSSAWRGRRASV